MAYTKQDFQDNYTILSAEHLNHIEDGILKNSEDIAKIDVSDARIEKVVYNYLNNHPAGLTSGQVAALNDLLKIAIYDKDATKEYQAFKNMFGIVDYTLEQIIISYTGGAVPVGTPVSALTGLTVLAWYSNGTAEEVTDYTLIGVIREGSNTIAVKYGDCTTYFTVIGTAV